MRRQRQKVSKTDTQHYKNTPLNHPSNAASPRITPSPPQSSPSNPMSLLIDDTSSDIDSISRGLPTQSNFPFTSGHGSDSDFLCPTSSDESDGCEDRPSKALRRRIRQKKKKLSLSTITTPNSSPVAKQYTYSGPALTGWISALTNVIHDPNTPSIQWNPAGTHVVVTSQEDAPNDILATHPNPHLIRKSSWDYVLQHLKGYCFARSPSDLQNCFYHPHYQRDSPQLFHLVIRGTIQSNPLLPHSISCRPHTRSLTQIPFLDLSMMSDDDEPSPQSIDLTIEPAARVFDLTYSSDDDDDEEEEEPIPASAHTLPSTQSTRPSTRSSHTALHRGSLPQVSSPIPIDLSSDGDSDGPYALRSRTRRRTGMYRAGVPSQLVQLSPPRRQVPRQRK